MKYLKKASALFLAMAFCWAGQAKDFGWAQEEVYSPCTVQGYTMEWQTTVSMGVRSVCRPQPWSFCWAKPCQIILNTMDFM